MSNFRMKAAVAGGVVAAAALVTTTVGTPPAHAFEATVGMNCFGENPNILLFPFFGGAGIQVNRARHEISIYSNSKDAIPYTTDTTVRVTDLRSHRTQTFHRRWLHDFSDPGGYSIEGIKAHGPTTVTISSINRGLFRTVQGPTCRGTINV